MLNIKHMDHLETSILDIGLFGAGFHILTDHVEFVPLNVAFVLLNVELLPSASGQTTIRVSYARS